MAGKKKNNKVVVILLLCIALVLAAGAGCFVYFMQKQTKTEEYTNKLDSVRKYISDEEYSQAEILCRELIELDEKEEQAYLLLAEVYTLQGDYDSAIEICSTGYRTTGILSLKTRYDQLFDERRASKETEPQTEVQTESETEPQTEVQTEEPIDVEKLAKSVKGGELMKVFTSYVDNNYTREYGSHEESQPMNNDTILRVRYPQLAADVYYQNDENGEQFSVTTKLPFMTGKPFMVTLDNVRNIFGTDSKAGITYDEMSYLLGRKPEISTEAMAGKTVLVFDYFNCKVFIECDANGNLAEGELWNQIQLPQVSNEAAAAGEYYAAVINAVDGLAVSGAEVILTAEDGTEIEAYTESDGVFYAEAEPGEYEMVIVKDGFITEQTTIILEEEEVDLGTFSMSPVLENTEMRIVLEWNEEPYDLDSYYIGEYDDGTEVGVFFENMSDNRGGEVAVSLDLDDRDGYGPETITVDGTDGEFEFCVHDYLETGRMGSISDATVKVYLPDGTIRTFSVPSGSGNLWTVFRVDHGTITEVGTIE